MENQKPEAETKTENQESNMTFGMAVLAPLPDLRSRQDITNLRILASAQLDQLHLSLGATSSPLAQNMIAAAIQQVIIAADMATRAMAFTDEIVYAPEDDAEQPKKEEKNAH